MKKVQSINWEERCRAAERACEEMRKERAASREAIYTANKELLQVKEDLKNRPTLEVENIEFVKILPSWVAILVLVMGASFLGLVIAMNDRMMEFVDPVIQYKYVEHQADKSALLADCQADWRAQKAELKVLRGKLKLARLQPSTPSKLFIQDARTSEEIKDGLPPWDGHSEDESKKTEKSETGCPPGFNCAQ